MLLPGSVAEPDGGQAEQQEGQRSLLDLPPGVLLHILDRLASASDVAAAAAICSALRAAVRGSAWPGVSSLHAHVWTPALPASLGWAAAALPQLRHLDLSQAAATCDADLVPLSQLCTLTALNLGGLWRVTVSLQTSLECCVREP